MTLIKALLKESTARNSEDKKSTFIQGDMTATLNFHFFPRYRCMRCARYIYTNCEKKLQKGREEKSKLRRESAKGKRKDGVRRKNRRAVFFILVAFV